VVVVVVVNRPANHDAAARTDTTATAIPHENVQDTTMQRKRPMKCDVINITAAISKAKERSGEKPPGELP
jgi:hypothetical protein